MILSLLTADRLLCTALVVGLASYLLSLVLNASDSNRRLRAMENKRAAFFNPRTAWGAAQLGVDADPMRVTVVTVAGRITGAVTVLAVVFVVASLATRAVLFLLAHRAG